MIFLDISVSGRIIILLYMQSEQSCEYVYSVEQQSFKRDADDPITVSITVQLTCESSKYLINLLICMGRIMICVYTLSYL